MTLAKHIDPKLGRFVAGISPLKINEKDIRRPGADVPEAFEWPRRRIASLLSTRRLVFVPNTGDRKLVDMLLSKLSKQQLGEVCAAYGVEAKGTREEITRALLLAAAFESEPEPEPVVTPPTKAEVALDTERSDIRTKLEKMSDQALAQYAPSYGVVVDGLERKQIIDELARILAPDPLARPGLAPTNPEDMEEPGDEVRVGIPKARGAKHHV